MSKVAMDDSRWKLAARSEAASQLEEWLDKKGLEAGWKSNLTVQIDGSFVVKGLGKQLGNGENIVKSRDEKVLVALLKAIEAYNRL